MFYPPSWNYLRLAVFFKSISQLLRLAVHYGIVFSEKCDILTKGKKEPRGSVLDIM